MSSTLGSSTLSLTASQAATASPTTASVAANTVAWQTALGLVVAFGSRYAFFPQPLIFPPYQPTNQQSSLPSSQPSLFTSGASSGPYQRLGLGEERWIRGAPAPIRRPITLPGNLASTLVRMMLRYFFDTVLPPLQSLRTATTSSIGALSRPQPVLELPMYTEPEFREPVLAPPRPAVPRDLSSFRVPSNPYSGSSHSNPASPAH